MNHRSSLSAQIWRAIALGLFIILVWQLGNAALMPPRGPVAGADDGTRPPTTRPVPTTTIIDPPAALAATATTVAATPTTVAATPTAVPPTAPTVPPTAPAPATAKPSLMRVANTGGEGVFLRARPRMAERLRAWPDGTLMQATGQEAEGEGRRWLQVTDPAGTLGWIPAEFLTRV